MNGALPEDFAAIARDYVAKLQAEPAKIASRKASQNALNAYGPHLRNAGRFCGSCAE
ncbi:transketolase [Klebsiella pneumoniae]|nr:transketolase [Klebsiella pneumoniae]